tara:strand:+ start:232 stop:1062 length:831 start_codon:yes stop_codon:yes gene_type:complete
MPDEQTNYTLVQGASGSELSVNYNAENITIIQLLYQLDEAKKNKDLNAFEELVSVSEAVFLQDKFNKLPLEDRMRFENLIEDHADLKDRFYDFKGEVLDKHFPGIEAEFASYRAIFENARNEIYEAKKLLETNELKKLKAEERAEQKAINAEAKQLRKNVRLEERIRNKNEKKRIKQLNKEIKQSNKNNNLHQDRWYSDLDLEDCIDIFKKVGFWSTLVTFEVGFTLMVYNLGTSANIGSEFDWAFGAIGFVGANAFVFGEAQLGYKFANMWGLND